MKKTICELFAGVGGFRQGFEVLRTGWQTVWFNQWEPGATHQWAHENYIKHYGNSPDKNGEYHTCEDIATVEKSEIPDFSVLTAGFPCQDFSVAHVLSTAKGIEGKKGILWWQIAETIRIKRPAFCIFENVDRLLQSPSQQRGRDFQIILHSLDELGYSAEWRVINAADYGAAQKRRRVYIVAYRNDSSFSLQRRGMSSEGIITESGILAKAFPLCSAKHCGTRVFTNSAYSIEPFKFHAAGFMRHGQIDTYDVDALESKPLTLGHILEKNVDEHYYYTASQIERLKYYKSSKQFIRTRKSGETYNYSEGAIPFPDSLESPARTLITSEGSVSRTSHVICDPETGRLRRLTPTECERLQGFPDEWTAGMSERMRYKTMGNALVVPMISRMARVLDTIIEEE